MWFSQTYVIDVDTSLPSEEGAHSPSGQTGSLSSKSSSGSTWPSRRGSPQPRLLTNLALLVAIRIRLAIFRLLPGFNTRCLLPSWSESNFPPRRGTLLPCLLTNLALFVAIIRLAIFRVLPGFNTRGLLPSWSGSTWPPRRGSPPPRRPTGACPRGARAARLSSSPASSKGLRRGPRRR